MPRSSSKKRNHPAKKSVSTKKKRKNYKNSKRNLTKISGWLSKNPQKSEESQPTKAVESDKAQKEPTATTSRKQTESEKAERKRTFAKYGLHIPTFEDILEAQKKYAIHQQTVDKFSEMMNDSQESLDLNIDEPCSTTITLNCKELTKEDLRKAFKRNKKYICNIFNGTTYSERHERFQKENPEDRNTTKDLTYNTSMIVFTYEQIEELLSHLDKCFSSSDSGFRSNDQYFFKVLLPELCLKIFMDVHKMNYDEANEYLENMPLENRDNWD